MAVFGTHTYCQLLVKRLQGPLMDHSTIFLLGPPGSGKTSTGGLAAARLGLTFVDVQQGRLDEVLIAASADVVTVPWSCKATRGLARQLRTRGLLLGLWVHPLTLLERSTPPYRCVPSARLKTQGGFGRTGTATQEYRWLDRHADAVLELDDLTAEEAAALLAEELTLLRQPVDVAADLAAKMRRATRHVLSDYGASPAAQDTLFEAMGSFVAAELALGLSPRAQKAMVSDLEVAAMMAWYYTTPTKVDVLAEVCRPSISLFRRKFGASEAAARRFERTLERFRSYLEGRNSR